jgi:hypothetical protein
MCGWSREAALLTGESSEENFKFQISNEKFRNGWRCFSFLI